MKHEDKRINLTEDQGILSEIVHIYLKFGPDGFRANDRYVFVRSVEKGNGENIKITGRSTAGMVHHEWPLSNDAFVCLGNEHLLIKVPIPAVLELENKGRFYHACYMVNPAPSAWSSIMRTLLFQVMLMSKSNDI